MKSLAAGLCFLVLFLGCSSARYACKDVIDIEGEKCDPISVVYEKKILGEGDSALKEKQKKKKPSGEVEERASLTEDEMTVRGLTYEEEKPLRLPPRVIRIWIAPWEDADGDLHQPSYIYSEISPKRGRWLFGEKEFVTGQPLLRPLEKPSEEAGPDKEREREGKEEEKKREKEEKGERTGRKGFRGIGPSKPLVGESE